jgi:hypothetical protein
MEKKCDACGITKPWDAFYIKENGRPRCHCKLCTNIKNAIYRKTPRGREAHNSSARRRYKKLKEFNKSHGRESFLISCSKCLETKMSTEFNRRLDSKTGYQGNCKKCQRIRLKNLLQTDRGRAMIMRAFRNYVSTKKGRDVQHAAAKKYRQKYGHKVKAMQYVNNRIIAGELQKAKTLPCSYCPRMANHWHHHKGYDRENWMNVIPLCAFCHRRTHRGLGPATPGI